MATEQLRLVDGTIVRKCPTIKPLYCSRAGKFYSVHNAILTDDGWVLREIKPVLKQAGPRKCTYTKGTGTHYPFMRHFQNKHCHFLVAAAWLGSRPEGMVIDHLNANILDWSADNLEYVTPAENRRADLPTRGLPTLVRHAPRGLQSPPRHTYPLRPARHHALRNDPPHGMLKFYLFPFLPNLFFWGEQKGNNRSEG